MRDPLPQLSVLYDENLPEEIVAGFRSSVADPRLELQIQSRPAARPQAGLEWLIPTAVIIFFGKAYIDAFLKEAGKDHYKSLKSGMSWLWRTLIGKDRKVNVKKVSTGGKISETKYSLALSIMSEGASGCRFKLLIEDSVDEEQFHAGIALFIDFIEAYFSDRLNSTLAKEIRDGQVRGWTILIAYDAERGRLRVVDPVPRKGKKT